MAWWRAGPASAARAGRYNGRVTSFMTSSAHGTLCSGAVEGVGGGRGEDTDREGRAEDRKEGKGRYTEEGWGR